MIRRIAISLGDYNGIGPELILRISGAQSVSDNIQFLVFGPASVFDYYAELLKIPNPLVEIKYADLFDSTKDLYHFSSDDSTENTIDSLKNAATKASSAQKDTRGKTLKHLLISDGFDAATPKPGEIGSDAGDIAMKSIKMATNVVITGRANAIVTAPISKESIHLAGYKEPGHTEYLSKITNTRSQTMMLVNDNLRVGLATTHIPLKDVAIVLSSEVIFEKLKIMNKSLNEDFGISDPRIAVFGLNPHAGDGGVIGDEEQTIIAPALEEAKSRGIFAEGPFAADGWFGNRMYEQYDSVLAMYHDQGLAPFKALSFGKGVNFTAGLPIIRTSPDHGTAFALAGKGTANLESFLEAIKLADRLSHKGRNH